MPRESQADKLARYRDRIDSARSWRESQGYVSLWRRMVDLYRGKQLTAKSGDSEPDEAMVNLAFSVLNIIVSSVTTQYPKFTVASNVVGQDDQATIAEAVLNYAWRHYNFHHEFQLAIVDMCMIGHGWLKVGWRYEEVERTLAPDEQFAQVAQQTAAADVMAAQAPTPAMTPEMPTDEQIQEGVQPTQPAVQHDDPFVERVSVFDVVIDPEATCYRELRWIAQRLVRDLKQVQDDGTYDARARNKVQADSTISRSDEYNDQPNQNAQQGLSEADEDDRCTIWEFYDIQSDEWCVFAEAGEGFLIKPEPCPTPFSNPFVMYRDYDVPDVFYPMGEIESIEELQEELNKTRTQQINARKQFIRKFIAREAALTPRVREALMSEIDGDVAPVEDDDRPLQDVIIPAPSLTFDPNLFNAHSSQIINDLQMVTGLSDYEFGQMPDTRRLATEAMAVQGAANARASFKLSKVERTLAETGRYLLQVMQKFMDGERVARVAGPGGQMVFQFTPDDIQGEFDLLVEAGSTQPKNDMIRKQEAITLFNTLAPYMGALIDPHELIAYLLQQGYDMKNVDRFFVPPPQPMIDPNTGQPMVDPNTGQPMMQQPGQPGMPPGQPGMPPGAPAGPGGQGAGAPPAAGPPPAGAPTNGQPPVPAGV